MSRKSPEPYFQNLVGEDLRDGALHDPTRKGMRNNKKLDTTATLSLVALCPISVKDLFLQLITQLFQDSFTAHV